MVNPAKMEEPFRGLLVPVLANACKALVEIIVKSKILVLKEILLKSAKMMVKLTHWPT